MKILLRVMLLLLVICTACNQPEKSRSVIFPTPVGRVNDFGSIFSVQEEKIIDSLIAQFEISSPVEIKLVTLDSTMTTVEGFNSYILRMTKAWNIGKKSGKDDGVLIGISPSFHRVRITNGLGLEKSLTDIETKRILNDFMFPKFREGDYFEGTRLGLNELIRVLQN